jgi:Tol biopolymer transport system component
VVVVHDAPGAQLRDPSWSPDGAALYYSYYLPTYRGGVLASETVEVRRTALATGATTTVASAAAEPTASADGAWVAVVGQDEGAGQSLRLIPAAGGPERTLIASGAFDGLAAPRFSPDGSAVAFAGLRLGPSAPTEGGAPTATPLGRLLGPTAALAHGLPWEVWTLPLAGGPPRQLTRLGEDIPCPAWASDRRQLLVQGEMGIYLVDAASGATRRLGDPLGYGCPAWRADA